MADPQPEFAPSLFPRLLLGQAAGPVVAPFSCRPSPRFRVRVESSLSQSTSSGTATTVLRTELRPSPLSDWFDDGPLTCHP